MSDEAAQQHRLMREVATTAATQAVSDLFIRLGIDVNNPLEVQRDMMALRSMSTRNDDVNSRKDLLYLRELRLTSERIRSKTLLGFVAIITTGVVSAITIGFKSFFSTN